MNARFHFHLALVLSAFFVAGCDGSGTPEERLQTMTREVAEEFPEVPQLATKDLAAWLADPERKAPQLVDAREPKEFAVSQLPGAIRIDADATADQVRTKIDPARPVVLYCSVGYRSSQLAERLTKAGFARVMNLEGSIFKWANEGRPLVSGGEPAEQVHPYNRKFGKMLKPDLHAEQ